MDALPYIDAVNEDYEHYALGLIQDEMRVIPPPLLPKLAPVHCRTRTLQAAYPPPTGRQLQQRDSGSSVEEDTEVVVDTKRPDDGAAPDASTRSVVQWQADVQRAKIAYETERLRSMWLELERSGDGNAAALWKDYNQMLEGTLEFWNQTLSQQQSLVQAINHARQQEQHLLGRELDILTNDYQARVQKIFSLRRAVAEVEQQILDGNCREHA
jgi:pre-mRNA-splicing factor SPF27